MGKGYLKPCSDKWRNHMGEVFPTHILAGGRYHYFEFISTRKLSVVIGSNIGIKCFSNIKIKWVLVWVQNWIVNILTCCNLWPKHMVMFALHWASKEWIGCLWNLSFLPHISLGLEVTVLKSSPTPLCYSLFSQRNSGFLKFLPYFPKNDLGPISLSPEQATQTIYTSCHSHTETHRMEQDISSAAQSVVNTEFRLFLRVSSCWSWKPPEMEVSQLLWASGSFVFVEFYGIPSLMYSSSLPMPSGRETLHLRIPASSPQSAVICKTGRIAC